LAEREGFEPSVEFPLHTLSKRAPSTTRTSLRAFGISHLRASRLNPSIDCNRNCSQSPSRSLSFAAQQLLGDAVPLAVTLVPQPSQTNRTTRLVSVTIFPFGRPHAGQSRPAVLTTLPQTAPIPATASLLAAIRTQVKEATETVAHCAAGWLEVHAQFRKRIAAQSRSLQPWFYQSRTARSPLGDPRRLRQPPVAKR
jgi:hypothetical protein